MLELSSRAAVVDEMIVVAGYDETIRSVIIAEWTVIAWKRWPVLTALILEGIGPRRSGEIAMNAVKNAARDSTDRIDTFMPVVSWPCRAREFFKRTLKMLQGQRVVRRIVGVAYSIERMNNDGDLRVLLIDACCHA